MQKQILKIFLFLMVFFAMPGFSGAALDTEILGNIYGDTEGLARVASLESQLHVMQIKSEHPRIIMTPELVIRGKERIAAIHSNWDAIQSSASSGNMINSAFAYLMTDNAVYANNVYASIMADSATTWIDSYTSKTSSLPDRKVAQWAIAFDWVYNGLNEQQRNDLIAKIGSASNIAGRAAWINGGGRDSEETFHRENWIFYAWKAWPELALAGHFADADLCYKKRWDYSWIQGDAARAFAYLNDGTPLEGYQYGADGTSWLMALKSSTGINLVDGIEFQYDKSASDYQLYGMDFGLNRNVFHHGVGIGAGGLWTYSDTLGNNTNWKLKEYHSMAAQLSAETNPYQQWFAENILTFNSDGASSWIFSNEYYNKWSDFENISTLLFYDSSLPSLDPRIATYSELPFAKHFEGGNEVYMRSSWSNGAAMAALRSAPAFTKTAHGDFDVNTFLLYRKGNLAPDSGVYDNAEGQRNYLGYQKNTVAHNDILVIDPTKPDAPTKLSSSKPDPGGTDLVSARTFGNLHPVFPPIENTFLLNSKADWGDIVSFETNSNFDYSVGSAAKAYGTRVNEYDRATVFIRKPDDKAYFLVYDRVNATDVNFKKKWLLHLVGEPSLDGSVIDTEVAGNIYTTNGNNFSSNNVYNSAALYGKVLLPQDHNIRKIGGGSQSSIVTHGGKIYIASKNHISDSLTEPGTGSNWAKYWQEISGSAGQPWSIDQSYNTSYEFWVDGANPRNFSIDKSVMAESKESNMGGPLEEIGQWRLELMPTFQQSRDIFLNVLYMGDVSEVMANTTLVNTSEETRIGALIKDSNRNEIIIFNKNKFGAALVDNFNYDVDLNTPTSEHIITEVVPSTSFVVKKDGIVIETLNSSEQGILTFNSSGTGSANFSIASSFQSDGVAPASPSGLSVE